MHRALYGQCGPPRLSRCKLLSNFHTLLLLYSKALSGIILSSLFCCLAAVAFAFSCIKMATANKIIAPWEPIDVRLQTLAGMLQKLFIRMVTGGYVSNQNTHKTHHQPTHKETTNKQQNTCRLYYIQIQPPRPCS